MNSRRFGAVADDPKDAERDARVRHVARLLGRVSSAPASFDISHHLDAVLDQGGTGSCVGHWFSNAIYLTGQAQGRPVPRPSRRWAYDVARYRGDFNKLIDDGCRPRDCVEGAAVHGIVAEVRFPWDPALVNEAPPFDLDVAGGDALFTGYYRIEGDVVALTKLALSQGFVPGLAMQVHESFVDLGAYVTHDLPAGENLGRHMITVIGYRPGAFRILNSWGTDWADGGFGWLSERFVASLFCGDRYVATAAPLAR